MISLYTDPRCLNHEAPPGYPEKSERLRRILARLEDHPGVTRQADADAEEAHPQAQTTVAALHQDEYIRRFEKAVARGDGILDSADNPLSPATWEAAWGAVDTVLRAADGAAQGVATLAAVRPPGHHAEADRAMGFCFFGNIAVAAEHLRRHHGLERVAIYDFDVHHGNGTQHLFEERGDVFFASSHQFPFYPGTGAAHERGRGPGEGATLNIPLAEGTGDEAILEALSERILPALRHFEPQALLISAGFDAWREDPLGGLRWSEEIFRRLGRELAALAAEVCDGRLLSVLEGGYDVERLPGLVQSYLEGIIDFRA
jgi:acetoin utilization deacetylase AcuC-like enzyme